MQVEIGPQPLAQSARCGHVWKRVFWCVLLLKVQRLMLISGNLVWSFGVVLNISANPTLYLHLSPPRSSCNRPQEIWRRASWLHDTDWYCVFWTWTSASSAKVRLFTWFTWADQCQGPLEDCRDVAAIRLGKRSEDCLDMYIYIYINWY